MIHRWHRFHREEREKQDEIMKAMLPIPSILTIHPLLHLCNL